MSNTGMADDSQRQGATSTGTLSRGKCLYKTGKCNNERALKTSGQAHNLCDEHRHRQNEHQRKLDAKNRYSRKDKRGSCGSAKGDSPTGAMAVAAAAAAVSRGHRYSPYPKMRMSPNGAGTGGLTGNPEEIHAMLGRNGIVATSAMTQPMMQYHSMGVGGHGSAGGGSGSGDPSTMMAAASHMGQMAMSSSTSSSGAPEILPSGVVILPNGPQAPQMPYPTAMQDFDGIVVPLPSYLEGHERVEFRSRIYQKVLDFIAEECMRRFGAASVMTNSAGSMSIQPQSTATPATHGHHGHGHATLSTTPIVATATATAPTSALTTEAAEEGATKQQPRTKSSDLERKTALPRGDQEDKDSDDSMPEDTVENDQNNHDGETEDDMEAAEVAAEAEAVARSKRSSRSRATGRNEL